MKVPVLLMFQRYIFCLYVIFKKRVNDVGCRCMSERLKAGLEKNLSSYPYGMYETAWY